MRKKLGILLNSYDFIKLKSSDFFLLMVWDKGYYRLLGETLSICQVLFHCVGTGIENRNGMFLLPKMIYISLFYRLF